METAPHQLHSADWRANLLKNKRRSRLVIAAFMLLYLLLGFLVDLYLQSGQYPQAPLSSLADALIHFQLFPKVTLIAGAVAAISIWVTFIWHDKLMLLGNEYREVTAENQQTPQEKQLYNIVQELQISAGLRYMPKVFIIDADYMNAFASGYSEKSAMVAITRGLITKLERAELQAVMAHEISHIRHMDIKLTLLASVLSNLILIAIDVMFYGVVFGRRGGGGRGEGGANILLIVIMVLRYLLPLVTVLLMLLLSRSREYMADAGCVELTRDNKPLARALIKINGDHHANHDAYAAAYNLTPHDQIRREAYIFDPVKAGIESRSSISDWFSTHPSLAKRLAALGFKDSR